METVRELIESKPVGLITVKPDVTVKDAMVLMEDKHIHSLLVYQEQIYHWLLRPSLLFVHLLACLQLC